MKNAFSQIFSVLMIAVMFGCISPVADATSSYHIVTEEEEPAEDLPQTALPDIQPGDVVVLGHYEQDNDFENGDEVLTWLVLDRTGDKVLLITESIIDVGPYSSLGQARWPESILKKWMNEDFYYSALDEEIHKAIVEKELKSYTGVSKYKVFPLSQIEARKYFEKNLSYVSPKYFSAPTKYAMSKAKEIPKYSSIDSGIIRWWLYTNSKSGNNAALSGYKGNSYFKTDEVLTTYEIGGYRPAIWIDLSQAESFIYK